MAKCKSCKCNKVRIVSDAVKNVDGKCLDVCTNPICGSPKILSVFAPVIYDEIGINLCTTFPVGVDIPAQYAAATTAAVSIVNVTYSYGEGNVEVETIATRPNCYSVTLSNLTVQFAIRLYDCCCRLLTTLYQTAVYLPPETTAATYDEDTNPTSVELELFAPYGPAYDATADPPTAIVNYVGFADGTQGMRQGINLYAIPKLLNLDVDDSTVTVGVTVVLQSLYFAGYRLENEGKVNTPKGSIITPDESDCMRFVEGDLLNLAIKPLELGPPLCEEQYKKDCNEKECGSCAACTNNNDSTACPCMELPSEEE